MVVLSRLEGIYSTGEDAHEQAVSAYSDGRPGLDFPDSAFDEIAVWLRDAYGFAQDRKNSSFIQRLESLIHEYTHNQVTLLTLDKIAKRGWLVFGVRERSRVKSAPGKIRYGDVFIDGVDAMYLFQCFLEDLLENVRFEASVPPQPPPERSSYWSVAELAAFLQRSTRTVENWVSRYRGEHRSLPPWTVVHPPGSKKGFRIHKSRFLEFYEDGRIPGLGSRRSAR